MTTKESSEPAPPSLLRRRDFLALSAAGLLTPMFHGLAEAAPLAAAAKPSVQAMSVGYIDGSETFHNFKRLPRKVRRPVAAAEGEDAEASLVVVPAASLFQADSSLPGRPLRIQVMGLYPPSALEPARRRDVPPAIDLEAIFPSNDPTAPAPLRFFVWSLRNHLGWDPSPPISFRFPLEWQTVPQFVLRVRGADGVTQVLRTTFTLDNEPGRPRLRRGVYLLGIEPGAWSREASLADFARIAPAGMFSVMISMDPEPEA